VAEASILQSHTDIRQLLQEIEQKSAFAQQQLGIVRAQIASKNRESRMLQLSAVELDALPKETPIYDGVGKMYGSHPREKKAVISPPFPSDPSIALPTTSAMTITPHVDRTVYDL
jgi:hypothetical protein